MKENKDTCDAYDSGYCCDLGRPLTDEEDDICAECCCYNYLKIKKSLTIKERKTLDELLHNHFVNHSCGCNYENADDIRMCPIGMFEDGCSKEDLIEMIKDIVEQRREE